MYDMRIGSPICIGYIATSVYLEKIIFNYRNLIKVASQYCGIKVANTCNRFSFNIMGLVFNS